MPVRNADIAAIFEEIADLLEIEEANPFRVLAYRNAARQLQALGRNAADLVRAGDDLTQLPGIGKDLAAKIKEIVETGRCLSLEKLKSQSPPGLIDILAIPGLGPKRVHALYHELDIHTIKQLYRAAHDGRLSTLPGFGDKTQAKILAAIESHVAKNQRMKLAAAAEYTRDLVSYLKTHPSVEQIEVAGSFRRCKETVGDLDILIGAEQDSGIMDHFVAYDEVNEVVSKGTTRSTVILRNHLQVDVRLVKPYQFGAALHYFTGSKAHNIAIRQRGQKRGLKINEYGVFKGKKRIAGDTESSVFKAVGLPWIAPELRENRGEIEAAANHILPRLIEFKDLKGDLHAHTKATDGHNTLEEMADAARRMGFQYLAITEHSKRLTVAHGLDQKRLLQQVESIDVLNSRIKGITLLKGIEVDILEDGRLDLPDIVLSRLDLVIGAVHSKFHLSREQQTKRILKAMDNRYFSMLAHPTGRLLEKREAYDVDMPKLIRHAQQRGIFLELNAHPERLDLADVYCQMAKDEGVLISINSDAHSITDFTNLRYGIGQGRRGWLTTKDVLNTRSLSALRKLLARTMS